LRLTIAVSRPGVSVITMHSPRKPTIAADMVEILADATADGPWYGKVRAVAVR
jgi:hypothetical protein